MFKSPSSLMGPFVLRGADVGAPSVSGLGENAHAASRATRLGPSIGCVAARNARQWVIRAAPPSFYVISPTSSHRARPVVVGNDIGRTLRNRGLLRRSQIDVGPCRFSILREASGSCANFALTRST